MDNFSQSNGSWLGEQPHGTYLQTQERIARPEREEDTLMAALEELLNPGRFASGMPNGLGAFMDYLRSLEMTNPQGARLAQDTLEREVRAAAERLIATMVGSNVFSSKTPAEVLTILTDLQDVTGVNLDTEITQATTAVSSADVIKGSIL